MRSNTEADYIPRANAMRVDLTPITIKFKRLSNDAVVPTKAHKDDACFDLYSTIDTEIAPQSIAVIPLGFATEFPSSYFAAIYPRSGISTKKGIRLANLTGVIDAGYRGEWMLVMYNDSKNTQTIAKGERIAQFALCPVYEAVIEEVDELNTTDRNSGGFGSSGA